MVHIEAMIVALQVTGAKSIKEKRARTRGLRDKWGKTAHVAVTESGFQDDWGRAEWTFVSISNDRKLIDRTFASIEEDLQTGWDFMVSQIEKESL